MDQNINDIIACTTGAAMRSISIRRHALLPELSMDCPALAELLAEGTCTAVVVVVGVPGVPDVVEVAGSGLEVYVRI